MHQLEPTTWRSVAATPTSPDHHGSHSITYIVIRKTNWENWEQITPRLDVYGNLTSARSQGQNTIGGNHRRKLCICRRIQLWRILIVFVVTLMCATPVDDYGLSFRNLLPNGTIYAGDCKTWCITQIVLLNLRVVCSDLIINPKMKIYFSLDRYLLKRITF